MDAANDNILFGMPEDPEMFLAALATVQDYVKQLKKQAQAGGKPDGWFVAVYIPNRELEFLRPCFPVEVAFVDEWEPQRGDWDLVYKFDPETAYRLSLTTEQHVTTAFGILIGADPAQLPDLSSLGQPKKDFVLDGDILLLSFGGDDGDRERREELKNLIETHRPELRVGNEWLAHSLGLAYNFEFVSRWSTVVGARSVLTYAAAAMGKVVLELYPNDRHQKWLSKWSGKYQMIYGDNFPVEYIWRGLEGVLDRWLTTQTI